MLRQYKFSYSPSIDHLANMLLWCLEQLFVMFLHTFNFLSPSCEHGSCSKNNDGNSFCICEEGWKGESCENCVPYWNCPNQKADACLIPNECRCDSDQKDTLDLCFHKDLPSSNSCQMDLCLLNGSIRITLGLKFTNSLLNSSNPEYINLKKKLEKEVSHIDLKLKYQSWCYVTFS